MIPFKFFIEDEQQEQGTPVARSGVSRIRRCWLFDDVQDEKAQSVVPPVPPRSKIQQIGEDDGRVVGIRIIEAKKRRPLRLEPALVAALSTESDLF